MNYRALKFNWTATPHDRPTVFAYSRDATPASGTAFYASWNGATEVRAWSFYAAAAADGPWHRIGGADRTGFETTFRWANYSEWTFAEALDKDGNTIRASGVCRTFVPSEKLRASCDEWACATPLYAGNQSLAGQTGAPKPEDVDWENFSYREGFDRVPHYPPELSRRSSDLAWQIGPHILFITVVLVSVVLLYLSPRVYRRLVGRRDRGTDNKGEYVTVGAAAQSPHFRVEGAGEQAGSELHNI
ncbi:hypothetical protein DIS24_g8168 [Lasiodiplodia hormozganensis]|uniref:Uncharacterized protein n=1 Tax=Lasiodiplodia hormozganensis TaxID=869390 RepID=A0AA39Y379_9PEZI|nr:hypothetical protein DIS24_g8168 [Lasiodiplodia hormozganensis]